MFAAVSVTFSATSFDAWPVRPSPRRMSPFSPTVPANAQPFSSADCVPAPLLTRRSGAANCFQPSASPQFVNLQSVRATVCVPFALWLMLNGTWPPVKDQFTALIAPFAFE